MIKKAFIIIALNILGWYEGHTQSIKFKNETLNYGKIKMGSNGERVFEFKNTGDKPLILSNILSSCGCTIPKWSMNPIFPKEFGEIKLVYDTKHIGPFKKRITIYSNAIKAQKKVIYIKGEVIK